MNLLTISNDIFFIIFSIPIILVLIIISQRIIGFRTFGLYTPLALIVLLIAMGFKRGLLLFLLVFGIMIIVRYFLKKIKILFMTDTIILNSLMFYLLLLILVVLFLTLPVFKGIYFEFDIITILAIIFMSLYGESLVSMWEVKGFKKFVSTFFESLSLIIGAYFLLSWSFVRDAIFNYPIWITIVCIIIIILLSKWRALKIKELFEFREVIKNVELPKKK